MIEIEICKKRFDWLSICNLVSTFWIGLAQIPKNQLPSVMFWYEATANMPNLESGGGDIVFTCTVYDLITAPGGLLFRGGGHNNLTYCTPLGASQILKIYYVILHLFIISSYVEHVYVQYIPVHNIYFFIFIEKLSYEMIFTCLDFLFKGSGL